MSGKYIFNTFSLNKKVPDLFTVDQNLPEFPGSGGGHIPIATAPSRNSTNTIPQAVCREFHAV
jgi:hypothetical protein